MKLVSGARIVLSARAEGPAGEYPWIALRSPSNVAARITPIALVGSPKTPLTAILPAQPADTMLRINAVLSGGVRALELRPGSLPATVGRSRNQTLVIDRRYEGVSGHHLDITELDPAWALVVVHGDNGVVVEGVLHAAGARFRWNVGETMVLGASLQDHPTCVLTLARPGQGGG
jgi:pSer/pThr/pTyr-binding forkhead associated (FHA) protein